MAAKLSPAVVSTGPTDELLAKDGRGNTPQDTINKQSTEPSSESSEIGEDFSIGNIPIPVDKVESFLAKKISNPKISDSAAQQGLESAIGSRLVALYGEYSKDPDAARAKDKAVAAYRDDKTGRDRLQLKDAAGNIVNIWDRTDPTKAASLASAFQKISGNLGQVGLIDEKGKFAAALGLLDQAVALGIPKLIDDIVTYVRNNKEAKRLLIASARAVIMRSDLATLNKIIDLVGGEGVLQRVPDAIPMILTFYRFSWGVKPENYPEKRLELINTLNRLKPNWHLTTRNGVQVTDLTVTNYMSTASKTLLSLMQPGTTDDNYFDQTYLLECVLAGAYPSGNIKHLGRSMYPEIAAWGG